MIHFKNKRIDLCVTPNHNMFILQTNKKLTVETAEKCSKRSIFYMPEGKWIGKNEEYFDLDGHGRVKTEDLMYILGIFIGDGKFMDRRVRSVLDFEIDLLLDIKIGFGTGKVSIDDH